MVRQYYIVQLELWVVVGSSVTAVSKCNYSKLLEEQSAVCNDSTLIVDFGPDS